MELLRLQENFSQAKAELKTTTDTNTELKKSLDELAFQLRKRVKCGDRFQPVLVKPLLV